MKHDFEFHFLYANLQAEVQIPIRCVEDGRDPCLCLYTALQATGTGYLMSRVFVLTTWIISYAVIRFVHAVTLVTAIR